MLPRAIGMPRLSATCFPRFGCLSRRTGNGADSAMPIRSSAVWSLEPSSTTTHSTSTPCAAILAKSAGRVAARL